MVTPGVEPKPSIGANTLSPESGCRRSGARGSLVRDASPSMALPAAGPYHSDVVGESRGGVERSTAIVLFTDLVGSTELRSRLGEDAADHIRRAHDAPIAD